MSAKEKEAAQAAYNRSQKMFLDLMLLMQDWADDLKNIGERHDGLCECFVGFAKITSADMDEFMTVMRDNMKTFRESHGVAEAPAEYDIDKRVASIRSKNQTIPGVANVPGLGMVVDLSQPGAFEEVMRRLLGGQGGFDA